jgi:phosphodiesterase/alkaline phosphatase D-like protein
MRALHTHRRLLLLAVTTTASVVLTQAQIEAQIQAQILPPAKRAASVPIIQGPSLESVRDNEAIITWTSNNPGGTDEHFGVVHYGTDPEHLTQTAKSHIRLNQNHSYTVFRVRVDGLKPQTTYYYTVDSMQATGQSDGVKSKLAHFANP